MTRLCVNIDHIATIRQARGGKDPDPVHAAVLCELAGAAGITAHLREDRRHIQDRDIYLLKQGISTKLNLEMAPVASVVKIALDVAPAMVTLVPEKREERTTEGGLPVRGNEKELSQIIATFHEHNIMVSLFIDPVPAEISAAKKVGARCIELHTGTYANATDAAIEFELGRLKDGALAAKKFGLLLNAGHGLNFLNTAALMSIDNLNELNIGHAIVSRAVLTGLDTAVRDMLAVMRC